MIQMLNLDLDFHLTVPVHLKKDMWFHDKSSC